MPSARSVTVRPVWPLLAFAAFASAVYLVTFAVVVPGLGVASRPDVLAAGVAADLVVLVPLAFAGLVVWRGGARPWTVGPVVALSAVGAWWALPPAHRGVLDAAVWVVPLAEAAVAAAVVVALVRAARSGAGDVPDRLRAATARVLGDGAASRAVAYELAVLRYAVGRTPPAGEGAFPSRRSSGYGAVLAGVGVAGVLELVGGHLLVLHLWGPGAALAHGLLSGYALVWLWGDWRALGARPHRLGGGVLRVRCGLRAEADVPVGLIETVYHVRRDLPSDRPTLAAVAAGRPRFALDLGRPVVVTGVYGRRREVTRVALGVDEPDRFLDALRRAMAEASGGPPEITGA